MLNGRASPAKLILAHATSLVSRENIEEGQLDCHDEGDEITLIEP